MFFADTLELCGIVPIAAIATIAAVWYIVARVFRNTRLGRRANHFLDVNDSGLSPEDRVKLETRHPGGGGVG